MTREVLLQRDIADLRDKQQDSIALFKVLSTQVGLTHGEMIAEHLAMLQGQKFNSKEFDMSDRNGEQ